MERTGEINGQSKGLTSWQAKAVPTIHLSKHKLGWEVMTERATGVICWRPLILLDLIAPLVPLGTDLSITREYDMFVSRDLLAYVGAYKLLAGSIMSNRAIQKCASTWEAFEATPSGRSAASCDCLSEAACDHREINLMGVVS